ncbi:MAG: VTT domain-containing protein [Clostridia bacterium]|nr:VTT domain-containing protein [Clostridia bacterium]
MADKSKLKKRLLEYSFILLLVAGIVLIYFAVAKEIAEIFRMSETKDYKAVKTYLQDFGWKGGVIIAILEMLQMIVVFIPAEFVQIAAGLSYPIYLAIPICVVGICLGASVIFLIVRFLHLRLEIMERRVGKIHNLVHKINKATPMTVIMYLLFVMPLIPFGAICYFASSSNISYRRYIIVVATAVLPSVLSSYVLGNVMFHTLGMGTSTFVWSIVIVAILMIVLLLTVASIIKNKYFRKGVQRTNWFFYRLVCLVIGIYFSFKVKINTKNCVKIKDKKFIVLGTHTSSLDFVLCAKAISPRSANFIANRFYVDYKKSRWIVRSLRTIPKSLFTPDVETIKKVLEAKKLGINLSMCPEGRLSSGGINFPLAYGTAGLIKKLGYPVYFATSVGGYFAKPKWRETYAKTEVEVRMEKLLTEEQVQEYTEQQIEQILNEKFVYDECKEYAKREKVRKGSVDVTGLHKIIFTCPHCGKEFTLTSDKTSLNCSACGNKFVFDDWYLTDGKTISDLYREQKKNLEKQETFDLQEKVSVKLFDNKSGQLIDCGEGVCSLTNDSITYNGTINGEQTTFTHTPATLQALAFSAGEEFEFYDKGKLYYFYPTAGDVVAKWSIVWDILQERKVYGEKEQGSRHI